MKVFRLKIINYYREPINLRSFTGSYNIKFHLPITTLNFKIKKNGIKALIDLF